MNAKIKDVLGLSLIVLIAVSVIAVLSFTYSFKKSVDDAAPSFSVSGEGEVVAVPDVAQFSFSVITEGDDDLESLQAENTGKMNGIIEYLKGSDIAEEDIRTSNYNVSPRYNYFPCVDDSRGGCPPPEIAGYTVSQNVAVKVRNMDDTGSLLGGVVENGANNVSQLRFTIDDPDDLKTQAREEAFTKAQEKAKSLAEAGGFKLGRLISVHESDSGYSPPMPYAAEDGAVSRGSSESAQIEPGSQDVKVTVTLQYEIK